MNFFRRLFGPRRRPQPDARSGTPAPAEAIQMHDAYGREISLPREEWREKILRPHLERHRDAPAELVPVLVQALRDGFATEVLPFVEHLAQIDPTPERGQVLLAATLLELQRPADAELVLRGLIARRGESPLALVNLARARQVLAGPDEARPLYWRALELDPNLEDALASYVALEQTGQPASAALAAHGRVAALPDAWRARLWIARQHLEQRQLAPALKLYDEALERAPRPVPADLLQQMSGDLGNHAHLPELLQLTAPYYDVSLHGLPTGSNLLKAYHDLGQLEAARRLLDQLYAKQRPDWKNRLASWDAELTKARLDLETNPPLIARPPRIASSATEQTAAPAPLEITLLAVEGPVWLPHDSPATELFDAKAHDAPLVAFLGASAELDPTQPARDGTGNTPGDAAGRLARALPLWLTEQLELQYPSLGRTLVPWVVKPRPGFILGGVPWDDGTASRHARACVADDPADYLVITHLRCLAEPWTIELRLLRTIDAARLATATLTCSPSDPGSALPELGRTLAALLSSYAGIDFTARNPAAGAPPPPELASAYLLRLDQALAVRTAALEPAGSALRGEREILDGQLHLCLEQPDSLPLRLLFAHTLRSLRKTRPGLPTEYRAHVERLQREHPLAEPAQSVVARILNDALAGA
jgi:tetratricopeptide (TPR) repeat protein